MTDKHAVVGMRSLNTYKYTEHVVLHCVASVLEIILVKFFSSLNIPLDPNSINNHQMHFNIYNICYSQYSSQHVSADILAIFRVMLLLQEYGCC
jgi:hypothetical protein